MTKLNPTTRKPYRNQLPFERKGLYAMISDPKMWDQEGERLVVQAVHEAIRQTLGRIREETDGKAAKTLSQATKNRWQRFREKLRLDLSGGKTRRTCTVCSHGPFQPRRQQLCAARRMG